ncbi:MAG: IS66 family transposase [Blastocatellia bacterium]
MRDLHGVNLSEGAIAAIIERAGEKAAPVAEAIKEQVIAGEVMRSDETSARVKAKNGNVLIESCWATALPASLLPIIADLI